MLSGPIRLYQLWSFIVPGLLAKEKKWALMFIGLASPLFAPGVAAAYCVLPKGITVLLSFSQPGMTNLQDINTFTNLHAPGDGRASARLPDLPAGAMGTPNIVGVVKACQLAKYRPW